MTQKFSSLLPKCQTPVELISVFGDDVEREVGKAEPKHSGRRRHQVLPEMKVCNIGANLMQQQHSDGSGAWGQSMGHNKEFETNTWDWFKILSLTFCTYDWSFQ